MQDMIVRMVADWLGGDVNTRIAAVPVDGAEPQPPAIHAYTDSAYPTPNNLAIFDESRHPVCADFRDPPAMPALYVFCRGSVVMDGEPTPDRQVRKGKSPVPVVVMYMAANSAKQDAIRDGSRTLRAIGRSLFELSKGVNEASRLRNGIHIVLGEGPMILDPIVSAVGKSQVNGAVSVGYYVRDERPNF